MSTAVMAAQSARPGALDMPGSGALAAAAGPKGKGSEGACKIARCAANMAADGRNVLGRDGAASPGDQGGAWQSQGRNLTALRPAGGAGSRENLLRTMPWYPCNSLVPR